MAYTNIDDPSAYFQATTYTGAGADTEVTNSGNSDLKPDFLWIKNRTAGYGHFVVDSNRNISYEQNSSNAPYLETESTAVENNNQNWMQSVNTNGFTTGISEHINNNSGSEYVAWAWKANGATTASNTDGTVTTTTQVNSDAGFSIVTWAGGGTGTLGHGLGETPDMWIIKNRDYAVSWAVGFSDSNILGGRSKYLSLNTSGAISTYNNFWGTSDGQISSTTIGAAGDRTINISGNDYVGYFFKAKQGYSKFGKYVGNGAIDGPFVYTGFKPAFVLIKNIDTTQVWIMYDGARKPFNRDDNVASLYANTAGAEYTGASYHNLDILSNGFKIRLTDTSQNGSGNDHIYIAFAENPFTTSTGIPTTAR